MNRLFFGCILGVTMVMTTPAVGFKSAERAACNSINLGEVRVFYKNNMRCEKAKHYARRLYKTGGNDWPRRFSCESGSNYNEGGGCRHDFKPNKFFGWHPLDKHRPSLAPGRSSIKRGGQAKVLCWNKDYPEPVGEGNAQVRVEPSRCNFFKRGEASNAGAVRAISLDWSRWDNQKAVGEGTNIAGMGAESRVSVRLSKPVRNCAGRQFFSKATFAFPGGHSSDFKMYTCP